MKRRRAPSLLYCSYEEGADQGLNLTGFPSDIHVSARVLSFLSDASRIPLGRVVVDAGQVPVGAEDLYAISEVVAIGSWGCLAACAGCECVWRARWGESVVNRDR
jgi:hypothetical protein